MTNALTTTTTIPLMDPDSFGHMQRVANILANSPLFPDHLRKCTKEQAIANGVLVMNMALRLNEDPLTVSQNIHFVSGKPGWSASYMISKANQHGVFKNPIDWHITGSGDDLVVTAFAEMTGTGKEVKATVSMKMAKAEGWTRNAKYQSMPEQMLRYRSATFLIRLYCPEVMVGVPATIEIEASGMKDITPEEQAAIYAEREDDISGTPDDVEDAETVGSANADDTTEQANPTTKAAPPAGDDATRKKHLDAKQKIEGDLSDGAPVDGTRMFYAKALEEMQAEAPDIYAEVEAMLKEADQ